MKNALNNHVGMLGDIFLWLVANLKQGVIYFIKQALPPNISAGSVSSNLNSKQPRFHCVRPNVNVHACPLEGGGSQNWLKFGPRSCRMSP